VEGALEPFDVALAAPGLLQAVREDGGPGVHRRVDVPEVPLVRRQLPARVQVILLEHQVQLRLAEVLVHQRQREDVEGQIPGRIPGVFPLVRHRQDLGIVHVVPVVVAGGGAPLRLGRVDAVLLEPRVDIVVVELLGPEHPGQRLAHHVRRIAIER
jgi:hypothetical protein